MVICLEGRAEFALGKNDEGINHLIELANIEEPAIECKPFVPESPAFSPTRGTLSCQKGGSRYRFPDSLSLIVAERIS